MLDGQAIGADQVARLATIDSRDVLLSKVAGAFQAPLAKGASLLGSFTRNAASMFSQLIEKKGGAIGVGRPRLTGKVPEREHLGGLENGQDD